ncbi:MAG: SufD family Fe-S cluster assembly protein [Clostridia bacterium]|nr:SufD family Fe-S cluster assembly protein [Clostridia bacterium]
MSLTRTDLKLLREIAELEKTPEGAYNIRKNGEPAGRASTENITISPKSDRPGIDITVKDGTKNESVHIPVILTRTGYTESVYNDFYIGDGCDVLIVAGCGIHNGGCGTTQHDGIHTFHIGKNSRVRYVEKHYGEGKGTGEKIMNPKTVAYVGEGSFLQMDTSQIGGVDSTDRMTEIHVGKDAEAVVNEKLMTHGSQTADSGMEIDLEGEGSSGRVISRSVAKDSSVQKFFPKMVGKAACFGHVQCDSIIMNDAKISSIPAISAESIDAVLIHEAAIGKIAGDQLLKLMTLGLDETQAEERILEGFLS